MDVSLLMNNEHPLLLASVRLAVNLPRPDSRSEKVAFLKQHPNVQQGLIAGLAAPVVSGEVAMQAAVDQSAQAKGNPEKEKIKGFRIPSRTHGHGPP